MSDPIGSSKGKEKLNYLSDISWKITQMEDFKLRYANYVLENVITDKITHLPKNTFVYNLVNNPTKRI